MDPPIESVPLSAPGFLIGTISSFSFSVFFPYFDLCGVCLSISHAACMCSGLFLSINYLIFQKKTKKKWVKAKKSGLVCQVDMEKA